MIDRDRMRYTARLRIRFWQASSEADARKKCINRNAHQ